MEGRGKGEGVLKEVLGADGGGEGLLGTDEEGEAAVGSDEGWGKWWKTREGGRVLGLGIVAVHAW